MTRLVIDPLTRVGGHLRVELDVADGTVNDAWSAGTMYRGFETVLRGRDPRDAWLLAERVCGACSGVHALASVRAVENALGVTVPRNARLLRNLLAATKLVQDHVVHFYLRQALDWADPTSALRADPAATSALARSLSDWRNSSADHFARVRDALAGLLGSSQQGPFAGGSWGHPEYRLPPELNLLLLSHYLDALTWQRQVVRLRTMLGGKSPHPQTYLLGGMVLAPEWGGPSGRSHGEHPWPAGRRTPLPLSAEGLAEIGRLATGSMSFVEQVLVPDVQALAVHYPEWAQIGGGWGHYLSFGDFAQADGQVPALLIPRGRVMGRDLGRVVEVGHVGVAETVSHSWYGYDGGDTALLHPSIGQTRPRYTGPRPPYETLEGADGYSWLKAPRYEDDPMEVGPLARVLVGYAAGVPATKAGLEQMVGRVALPRDGLYSTLGRIVARAVEAQVVAAQVGEWLKELVSNLARGDLAAVDLTMWSPADWPSEASGVGLAEGPAGAVGHWLTIRDRRIADYQIVDASTWNGSPRDGRGRRGACEQALVGTPIADRDRPLEVLRTIHSFDLCPACAVH